MMSKRAGNQSEPFETFSVYSSEKFDESKIYFPSNFIILHYSLRFSDVCIFSGFYFRFKRTRFKVAAS